MLYSPVISRQSFLISFVILTLLSLKWAVGPSGKCVTTSPFGVRLSSLITMISVYPLATACLTIFLIEEFLRHKGVEFGIIRVNSFTNLMVLYRGQKKRKKLEKYSSNEDIQMYPEFYMSQISKICVEKQNHLPNVGYLLKLSKL